MFKRFGCHREEKVSIEASQKPCAVGDETNWREFRASIEGVYLPSTRQVSAATVPNVTQVAALAVSEGQTIVAPTCFAAASMMSGRS